MGQIQSYALAIFSSILFMIPSAILKALLGGKSKMLKILGSLFTLAIFAFYGYIVLVSAALMGLDEANAWAFVYLNSTLTDIFVTSSILAIIKSWMISVLLKKKEKNDVTIGSVLLAKIVDKLVLDKPLRKVFGFPEKEKKKNEVKEKNKKIFVKEKKKNEEKLKKKNEEKQKKN